MAVKLTKEDFNSLVSILVDLRQFRTVAGREAMISSALQGAKDETKIWANLNIDGDIGTVAGNVIDELAFFGRVTPGQEALGIFLNQVLVYMGSADEKVDIVRGIIEKYAMDRPVALPAEITHWKEIPNEGALRQERIIGENTLRDVRILQLAQQATCGVALIIAPTLKGSGFLIAPDLLMTNHHVIAEPPAAQASQVLFNFQLNPARQFDSLNCITVLPQANGKFYTNAALDFTIFQLQPIPPAAQARVLAVRRQVPADGERVAIIQHPFGQYKKVAMQNNFVSHYEKPWLRYTTSTEEGSSGSPVFNEEFEVVAIHHGARGFSDPNTKQVYARNEGAGMGAVLDDLKTNAGDIYALLPVK